MADYWIPSADEIDAMSDEEKEKLSQQISDILRYLEQSSQDVWHDDSAEMDSEQEKQAHDSCLF